MKKQLDLPSLLPTLMACVRDRTLPVKLAAERSLIHVLQLQVSEQVLQEYLKTLDGPTARTTEGYVKRVISKLAATESDEETEL